MDSDLKAARGRSECRGGREIRSEEERRDSGCDGARERTRRFLIDPVRRVTASSGILSERRGVIDATTTAADVTTEGGVSFDVGSIIDEVGRRERERGAVQDRQGTDGRVYDGALSECEGSCITRDG